jgi:hypothetical protein
VRELMASALRRRVDRALPDHENGRREFQDRTGIDIETDIQHVVACVGRPAGPGSRMPSSGMVLARGLFDEVKIEALMREHGATVEAYKGKRLIVASSADVAQMGGFALSFFKPGLVAVGSPSLIRHAVDLESGGDNITSNDDVMKLVKSLGSGDAWAVGRFDALRSVAQLPAGLAQLPAITWFAANGHVDEGVSGVIRAEARDDEAAKNLRDVIRGALALAKLQATSRPELQGLVQSLELGGDGKTVALSFSVPGAVFDLIHPAAEKANQKEQAH